MFVMGMTLDHSRIFQDAKCDPNEGQRNYNVCFFVFATLMGIAFLVATALPFKYKEVSSRNYSTRTITTLNILASNWCEKHC